MAEINSKEYWNDRFKGDWNLYEGDNQTRFFAEKMCELLPTWIIEEINNKKLEVCDIGCAEGDSLPVLKKVFTEALMCGEDIAENAVSNAQEKYPEFKFQVSDILMPKNKKKYDVVIASNVVEHFKDTHEVLKCIFERSKMYTIIMIPYREDKKLTEEHEVIFHSDTVPVWIDENYLIYAKSTKCDSPLYPGEQLLLIYSKVNNKTMLSDIIEKVSSDSDVILQNQIISEQQKLDECKGKLDRTSSILEEIKNRNIELQKNNDKLQESNGELKKNNDKLQKSNGELQKNNERLQDDSNKLKNCLKLRDEALGQCARLADKTSFKAVHLLQRVLHQLLKGNLHEKKLFFEWFWTQLSGKGENTDHRFNPIYSIRGILDEMGREEFKVETANTASENLLSEEQKKILACEYKKQDIIIFAVIDYDFRYQRPQHFASRFAKNGHRVFYINANFHKASSIEKSDENLYIININNEKHTAIYSTDWLDQKDKLYEYLDNLMWKFCIRDAISIVDYPNWVVAAEYLREKYGFKIVTDYMDDYTGFLNPAENLVAENCKKLLQASDLIIPSSQFLCDIAEKYSSKCDIVRNGTEFDHFNSAKKYEKDHKRKVIGYYGAVAHWFDCEKVSYVAENLPECDVVIIGEVTEGKERLEKLKNVTLLGEKAYAELPEFLAGFDVCLIPFDTSTDLIKATNPVKFYEYLSAGKKIVATEIPELLPFKDKYVYMSNDNKQFLKYIKRCLDNRDTLKSEEEKIEFAKENDWQQRYLAFAAQCEKVIPKVSIIVLTFNNMEYSQKCIASILNQTAYPNFELIIVDNKSTDGTVEWLNELKKENYPNVKVILNTSNLGFAGGNNVGINAANGKYVLLLNNDTVVTRGWITAMVKHLENNPKLGMCNPVTNSIGNESMIEAHYTTTKEFREFAYIYTTQHMNEEYSNVDRIPLFATLIRRELILEVGLLDDSYKVGMFEDDDFTESVKKAKYEITIAEDAFIHHINNASFKKLSDDEYKKIFEENKSLFEKKWNKEWTMPKYREGVKAYSNKGCGLYDE